MGLFIFDKDGTLIQLKRNSLGIRRPAICPEDQVLLPGVYEKLVELRAGGHKVAIASNQRAISQGLLTLEQAEALMKNAIEKLGGVDAWRICPFDAHARAVIRGQPNPYRLENTCRKPQPGMLIELMAELGVPPEDSYMVGDSWRDRRAAVLAGIGFISAVKFFQY
ncbi:MAG TPA: HAD-IIIA family hydrolase [Anaerolineaceae bacterium]|jgi:D-glycero-D-manno-heptose 1,7-bisphosphate phosphatase